MNTRIVRVQNGWAPIDDDGSTPGASLTYQDALENALAGWGGGDCTHLNGQPLGIDEAAAWLERIHAARRRRLDQA